jgi:hypothetical protein
VQAACKIVGPELGPFPQGAHGIFVQAVGGELGVVDPVGAGQTRLEVFGAEPAAGVTSAELFQVGGVPAAGSGKDIDQVAGCAAVCEGP